MTWRPILKGEIRGEARGVAFALAKRIAEASGGRSAYSAASEAFPGTALLDISRSFSLSSGAAGTALLFAYCDREWPNEGFAHRSQAALRTAIAGFESLSARIDLWDGFTGIAWVVDHLTKAFPHIARPGEANPNDEIDEALIAILEAAPDEFSYDLVSGAVGIGVYGLDRGDGILPRRIVELVVERLLRSSHRVDDGTYWTTPGYLAVSEDPAVFGGGYIDTGMAHGMAGAIGFLARAGRKQVASEDVSALLTSAVQWLRTQVRSEPRINRIPAKIAPTFKRYSNAAWCYGDPGIAAGLLAAAQATGSPDIFSLSRELGFRTAPLGRKRAGIDSCCLCHGSSGLALLFARLAQCTGDAEYAAAARAWFAVLLHEQDPLTDTALWADPHPFLSGPGGVVLALLAGATESEPAWDSALLLPHPLSP